MTICDKSLCTGCMACYSICPVDSISIEQDIKGFYYPTINNDKCINCNSCINVCPNNYENQCKIEHQKIYAAWSKDKEILKKSTSGGVFTGIAQHILNENGVVYGVAYSLNKVQHIRIEQLEHLELINGSKYVQSYVGDIYKEVKKDLTNNKFVLFSGTPCQIAGLNNYLKIKYDKLVTVDIICHGVPSPKLFNEYLTLKSKEYKSKVKNINFRKKRPTWTVFSMEIHFENNKKYRNNVYKDPFLKTFLSDIISRDSCHACKYTTHNRTADITLGDFWGYLSYNKSQRNTEKGISLVTLNTEKAYNIFEIIKDKYETSERTLQEAKRGNKCLYSPYKVSDRSNEFWKDIHDGKSFLDCHKKYCNKRIPYKYLISNEINKKYYLLPVKLRNDILKHINSK